MHHDAPAFVLGRSAGPVGRWVRLIAGLLLLAYAAWDWELFTEPHALGYYGAVAISLIAIFGLYLAAHALLGPRLFARVNPWVATLILLAPPVIVLAIPGLGSDAFRLGLILYIAISQIALFFIRYGGCEVVALPTLILHRRYTVYCPWNVVDAVDKAVAGHESGEPRPDPTSLSGIH